MLGLAGWSGPILDALEVSPETFRLAAGIVVSVAAVVTLVRPRPAEEPEAPGCTGRPVAGRLPEAAGRRGGGAGPDHGHPGGRGGHGWRPPRSAFGSTVCLGWVRRTGFADRVLLNTGRLVTVLLVIVAVFLMVDGIRDV